LVRKITLIYSKFFLLSEVCLKEGKKFLSEMPIYTYEGLNEHITYGEYSEKGSLVIPPHPVCSVRNHN
jgi:hypothetical protein